jgi:hypothetical protein
MSPPRRDPPAHIACNCKQRHIPADVIDQQPLGVNGDAVRAHPSHHLRPCALATLPSLAHPLHTLIHGARRALPRSLRPSPSSCACSAPHLRALHFLVVAHLPSRSTACLAVHITRAPLGSDHIRVCTGEPASCAHQPCTTTISASFPAHAPLPGPLLPLSHPRQHWCFLVYPYHPYFNALLGTRFLL